MEVKSWFDAVDLNKLRVFAIKHHRSDDVKVDGDILKITCEDGHTEREWTVCYDQFGSKENNNYNSINNLKEREFFDIMNSSNTNNTKEGKSYADDWYDAHENSEKRHVQSQTLKINKQIEELGTRKQDIKAFSDLRLKECREFIKIIQENEQKEKRLIVETILKGMSPKEQKEFLANLGYAPIKEAEKKDEKVVINNGLNDVVLDFDKPNTTEVDECDDYYV